MNISNQSVEWLIPIEEKHEQELTSSNLASIRLRTAVAAVTCKRHGLKNIFSDGHIETESKLIIVGKIDTTSDTNRDERWLKYLKMVKSKGKRIIVDYTDNHLAMSGSKNAEFYFEALELADQIVCPSTFLSDFIAERFDKKVFEIDDPIEVPIIRPHKKHIDIPTALWFGHSSNIQYLIEFLLNDFREEKRCRLIMMSNLHPLPEKIVKLLSVAHLSNLEITSVPWSNEDLLTAAEISNTCWLPTGFRDLRKRGASSNRLITALALGLPVLTDDLPSYVKYRRYYKNIRTSDVYPHSNLTFEDIEKLTEAQQMIQRESGINSAGKKWLDIIMSSENSASLGTANYPSIEYSEKVTCGETISIATITYNQLNFLNGVEKIYGELAPTIKHYIQDDCSTDGSWPRLNNFKASNQRRIFKSSSNLGPRGNISSLLEKIEGEYVIFTGGDDLIVPDTVNQLATELGAGSAKPDIIVFQCLKVVPEALYEAAKHVHSGDLSTNLGIRNNLFVNHPWRDSCDALTTAALNPGFLWLQGMVIKTCLAKRAGFLPGGDVDDWGLQHNIAVIAKTEKINLSIRKEVLCVLSATPDSYGSDVLKQLGRQVYAVKNFWHPNLRKAAMLRVIEKKVKQLESSNYSCEEICNAFKTSF